jgi:hypothetical protein
MAKTASPPGPAPSGTAQKPDGRRLEDFPHRSSAEDELLRCCRLGIVAEIGPSRPDGATSENRIRAGFLRFLALGGDDDAPVHEHGVQLEGAWLEGLLDLEGAHFPRTISMRHCRIEQIIAIRAIVRSLDLRGSLVAEGIYAPWLKCEGEINLGEGFLATGMVLFGGAFITGNFQAIAGEFDFPDGDAALILDGVEVGGDILLRNGFRSNGEVRIIGATVGGDLGCTGARIENAGGDALSCHGLAVTEVFLNDGFRATGAVVLTGATIRGSVECQNGSFTNPSGIAFSADRAEVAGSLFFRHISALEGEVHLPNMKVGSLCDDEASWCAEGDLILDGFTYRNLGGGAPTDAERRIAWLERQRGSHLASEFKPQPWEQLISVLRGMGHPEDARKVAIAKHRRMRAAGRYVGGSWLWDWIYGTLVGYGYRPWTLLRAVGLVWAACALLYWPAANPRLFGFETHLLVPASPQTDTACLLSRVASRSAEPCPPRKPRYEDLFLPAFSAEVLIPVISLGQKGEWRTRVSDDSGHALYWGWALRAVYWFEIFFGWLAGLLLVAAVGNLIKKE